MRVAAAAAVAVDDVDRPTYSIRMDLFRTPLRVPSSTAMSSTSAADLAALTEPTTRKTAARKCCC